MQKTLFAVVGKMRSFIEAIVIVLLVLCHGCVSGVTVEKLPISVLLLAWNNPLSLNYTLHSFNQSGLFDMTSEFIICFNEINDAKVNAVKNYPVHIIGSAYNVFIARAMQMLFATAQYPYALFVEKDFSIHISHSLVYPELKIAYDTVASQAVDMYQLRSRSLPGNPRYAKHNFYGKEDKLVAENSTYICTFSSWLNNTEERWPHIFKRCGEHKVLCVDSYHCNWSNNPFLMSVKFWTEKIQPAIQEMFKDNKYVRINEGHYHTSPHLLEPWMNKQPSLWKDKHYLVAKGEGIFTHFEIDG